MSTPKTVWIVGASTGIGRFTALAFAKAGTRVVASARSADGLATLAAEAPEGMILALPLDATDREACLAGFAQAEAMLGAPLDAVMACAATWNNDRGSQANAGAVRPLFEVNVFGALHLTEAALAAMGPRRSGRIAIVSSVAGFRGLPRALAYGASKAALTHIAEAMKFECDRQGIIVQVIHPGFVKTPLTDKNDFPMPFLMAPEAAAARIVAGMSGNSFEITFPRRFTYLLKLLRMMPYRLYFWLVGKAATRS
jgi:NAD(P)-dependent dehydrogenase (short-subunit alcohol dehydrogenase family)